jgi:hypothetical protein
MWLREETIGALNLFRTRPGRLSEAGLGIGQAMADVATVGLIQARHTYYSGGLPRVRCCGWDPAGDRSGVRSAGESSSA